jgi:predicted nucleic acid-binding protein
VADLFADTAGWANLMDTSQPYHALAANLYRKARLQGQKVVTTNYIIAELVALMTSPLRIPRPSIIAFVDGIRHSPHVEIIQIDASTDEQAWLLFKARPDKDWSLVDCASFVVMQRRSLTHALTTDHHFEQAGLTRMLK